MLTDAERETLIALLKRLHENLPALEAATEAYDVQRFPKVVARRRRLPVEDDDE